MSVNLYWKPVIDEANDLPTGLKWILEKRFGILGTTGITLSYQNIEYLNGLVDADVKGAKDLIDAIEQYNEVIIFTQ